MSGAALPLTYAAAQTRGTKIPGGIELCEANAEKAGAVYADYFYSTIASCETTLMNGENAAVRPNRSVAVTV